MSSAVRHGTGKRKITADEKQRFLALRRAPGAPVFVAAGRKVALRWTFRRRYEVFWMRRFVWLNGVAGALVLAASALRAHQPVTAVTWVDDIAPIVESRCLPCHGSPARAALRLDSYAAAHDAARRMKREVLERRMPPWPAAQGFADYENDPSLSAVEKELIAAWADGGAPMGAVPGGVSGAQPQGRRPGTMGRPDLLLRSPAAGIVREASRTIRLTTGRSNDGWIGAWEFRPGNPAIVEQAELSIAGGDLIGVWVPPDGLTRFPPGVAQRLPANASLSLKIFYKKSGSPETDDNRLAIYFAGTPRKVLRHRRLQCGTTNLEDGIDVLAIRPEIHRSGQSIEAVARESDGKVRVLVSVPQYQIRFEPAYRFRVPVLLHPETEIALNSPERDCAADLAYVER